jgi:hypothetical protein
MSGKKSLGGTFTFSNCHIIGLDTGSLVLIVFAIALQLSFVATLGCCCCCCCFLIPSSSTQLTNGLFIYSTKTYVSCHLAPASEVAGHIMLRDLLTQIAWNKKPRACRFRKYHIENSLWGSFIYQHFSKRDFYIIKCG